MRLVRRVEKREDERRGEKSKRKVGVLLLSLTLLLPPSDPRFPNNQVLPCGSQGLVQLGGVHRGEDR